MQEQAVRIQSIYTAILKDVLEGENLQKHLEDVESAIKEIDINIKKAEEQNGKTEALKSIRNDLFYLLYEIKERV